MLAVNDLLQHAWSYQHEKKFSIRDGQIDVCDPAWFVLALPTWLSLDDHDPLYWAVLWEITASDCLLEDHGSLAPDCPWEIMAPHLALPCKNMASPTYLSLLPLPFGDHGHSLMSLSLEIIASSYCLSFERSWPLPPLSFGRSPSLFWKTKPFFPLEDHGLSLLSFLWKIMASPVCLSQWRSWPRLSLLWKIMVSPICLSLQKSWPQLSLLLFSIDSNSLSKDEADRLKDWLKGVLMNKVQNVKVGHDNVCVCVCVCACVYVSTCMQHMFLHFELVVVDIQIMGRAWMFPCVALQKGAVIR